MIRLLRSPELRHALGSAARQFVVTHRSLEAMVSGYEELISKLYEQKAAHSVCAAV
jgi:hypothetical protein